MLVENTPREIGRSNRIVFGVGLGLVVTAPAVAAFLAGLGAFGPQAAATPATITVVAFAPTRAPAAATATALPPTAVPTATTPPTATPSPTPELGTSNVYVEYIVDASGSMTQTLPGGPTKLAVAKKLLADHLAAFRPETNIGLRAYGHRIDYRIDEAKSCEDIELIAPPKPGNLETIATWLKDFKAQGMTPLAASLQQALNDFDFDASRSHSIVMLSDGIETCGGDPCQLVRDLKAKGFNFTIHVIGLSVDGPTRQQLQCVAQAAGGTYHDANSEQDLAQALGAVKQDVTKNEVVTGHGINTPTSVPPTSTFMPIPPTNTPTRTQVPPTATSTPVQDLSLSGQIVFLSNRDRTYRADYPPMQTAFELYVMNPDGSGQRSLTSSLQLSNIERLSYAQTTGRLLFTGGNGSTSWRLPAYVLLANPKALVRLPGDAFYAPVWSPEGTRIVYARTSNDDDNNLCMMNADGSNVKQLTTSKKGHMFADWTPDGKRIVYMEDYKLFIMNADGSGAQALVSGFARNLAISPDGKTLAFESGAGLTNEINNIDIWIASIDGSDARNLTNSPKTYDAGPAWSPDSKAILWGLNGQIMRLDLDTGQQKQLTTQAYNMDAVWIK